MKEWKTVFLFVAFGLALVALYYWYVPVSAEEYAGTEEAQEYIVSPDVEPEEELPPGDAGSMAEDIRILRYIAEMVYNVWCPLGAAVVLLRGVYRWFYGTFIGPGL